MEDLRTKQKVLETLTILNTAIKNIRLYPPTSATIVSTIERLYSNILEIIDQTTALTLSESEKNILVCGELLPQREQEKPYIKALSAILTGFGVKSITFNKGVSKEDLSLFIELLSKKPDAIGEGGLQRIMADNNLSQIDLDQKVYVAVDKNHKIISSLDITDDQITQFITNGDLVSTENLRQLKEMVDDPKRLSRIFHSGLSQIMEEEEISTDREKSEKIEKMMAILDKVAGRLGQEDRDLLLKDMGKSIAAIGTAVTSQLKTQNIDHLFGGILMEYIVKELSQTKTLEGKPSSPDLQSDNIRDKDTLYADQQEHQNQPFDLQEALNVLLKDEGRPSLNAPLMSSLPKIIDKLVAQKQGEAIEIIIDRLIKNMSSEDAEVRARESEMLIEIMDGIAPEKRRDLIEKASGRLLEWIKYETLATPPYEKICIVMQNLVDHMIGKGQLEEAIPILNVFNDIRAGMLGKNDKIRDIASSIICNLADEEHIHNLFKEFCTNERNKQVDAGRILVCLGENTLNLLLDVLRETENSDERVRIMHLIIEMGTRTIPFIKERINDDEPWYYLRNLAYLLGQIGNEESAAVLQTLMHHKDNRLQMEALKSIYRTGGTQRGSMLISALANADEQFKLRIIETIGNAKCADVVLDLIDILKSRPLVVTSFRSQLEEKICVALGSIGSAEAIPYLSEIAESNSFLRLWAYPEKLKIAAGRALASIRKKQSAVIFTDH